MDATQLKDIGQTFAIGAYAIAGVEVLTMVLLGFTFYRRLGLKSRFHTAVLSALLIGLAFAAGIVVESVSKSLIAKHRGTTTPGWVQRAFLPSEDELRAKALFFDHDYSVQQQDRGWKATPLARKLGRARLFTKYASEFATPPDTVPVDDALGNENSAICKGIEGSRHYREAALALYYVAKNRVYLQPTYFIELARIEARIDFVRAFAFVSAILACYAAMLALIAAVVAKRTGHLPYKRPLILRSSSRQVGTAPVGNAGTALNWWPLVERFLCVFVFLVGCYLVSRSAFRWEHDAYVNRVFGYFQAIEATPPHNTPSSILKQTP